jgi:hypothetical protein
MRVFSVEMLVKEEGAAVVEAALKRLKKETQDVAAEFKKTSGAAGDFGRQSQAAGGGAQIAGDRAAKAAIGFAAVGQSIARTGSVTADAGTRIIEAGSQIATMFGPGGLAVAALLGFAAAALTSFRRASDEAKKMADETTKALREMVLSGDITNIDKQLRTVQQGVLDLTTGEFVGGLDDLREKYKALNDQIAATVITEKGRMVGGQNQVYMASQQEQAYNKLVTSAAELRKQIQGLEADEAKLLRARQLAQTFTKSDEEKLSLQRFEERESAALKRGIVQFKKYADEVRRIRAEAEAEINRRIAPMVQRARSPIDVSAQKVEMAGISVDLAKITLDIDKQLMRGVRWDNIKAAFSAGIRTSVTDGIRAGLEAALMSGDIGNFTKALAQTLSGSLAKAMTDYLMSGMKELWQNFGKTIVKGLADTMAQFAQTSIVFAKMMAAIKRMLEFGNGAGALIVATALLAFAHANGGKASMGNTAMAGGAGGLSTGVMSSTLPTQQIIFGATSATTAAGMTPRQSMNVTVIGPNDPSAQRAIQELMTKANSRGRIG